MEAIVVNKNAQQNQIDVEVRSCMDFIKENASKGISSTELLIPKHVASEVRAEIEKQLTESGTRFEFQVVRRSPNEFTGRMQYFTSELVGDERRYKLQIF